MSLDAPTFGVAGKAVRIPFTIDSSLPRDYSTNLGFVWAGLVLLPGAVANGM